MVTFNRTGNSVRVSVGFPTALRERKSKAPEALFVPIKTRPDFYARRRISQHVVVCACMMHIFEDGIPMYVYMRTAPPFGALL